MFPVYLMGAGLGPIRTAFSDRPGMDSTGAGMPLMGALSQRKRHLCGGEVKNAGKPKSGQAWHKMPQPSQLSAFSIKTLDAIASGGMEA
jgi:hypothetical protein